MRGIVTVQDIRDVINSLNITLLALEEGYGLSIGNINFHIKATREQVTELKRVMRIYGPASIRFHYFTLDQAGLLSCIIQGGVGSGCYSYANCVPRHNLECGS